ncbi:hypothetical protein [Gimesia aquarii]|uniref:Uncharacterized protein n=1 Tax=Gimesia aquarii TaxID=2527964 RepID=A0A517WS24_9PLAN|nr:hypothetical protein [Gimesia aquarii]QDU08065.1 hypothetical protein V202x_14280 [Gimesia aquarii]
MDRRQAVQAGLLSSGALLFGKNLFAQRGTPQSTSLLKNDIQLDSDEIVHNSTTDTIKGVVTGVMIGTENLGKIGRGVHAREFSVPEGTHLILGQVQEAGNYGNAKYETLGIAINTSVWRCRVIWKMEWDVGSALTTHFHWVKF